MTRRYSKSDLALLQQNLGAELPAPVPKKKRSQEESEMQRALIGWWRLQHRAFGVPEILLFSIPNGGWRPNPITGTILKAEGLRRGAPDLMLAVPRTERMKPIMAQPPQEWHALFLELKRKDGVVSPEQEGFHVHLRRQGYKVVVTRSLVECINEITSYLKNP